MALSIVHYKSNTFADYTGTVTVANSSGGTATVSATDLVRPTDWNSIHSIAGFTQQMFEPYTPAAMATFAVGMGTWYFEPIVNPFNLESGRINRPLSLGSGISAPLFIGSATISSGSTGIRQRVATVYIRQALYSRGGGTDSSRLVSWWSREDSILFGQSLSCTTAAAGTIGLSVTNFVSFPWIVDSLGATTYTTSGSNYGTTTGATSMDVSKVSTHTDLVRVQNIFTGGFQVPTALATAIPAGDNWLAVMYSTSSSQASTGAVFARGTILGGAAPLILAATGVLPQGWFDLRIATSASASTSNWLPGKGYIAATVLNPPATVAYSGIVVNATNPVFYWNYQKF